MPTNQDLNGSVAKTGDSPVLGGSGTKANGGVKGEARGVLGGIQQRVTSRVDEQKNRAADGLGGIADVFRSAGNELRSENEALASYVDMASDQMRRFADTIRQRGVADMMDDVTEFARRRPALFVGGAFLIGLGIARFLKSSADRGDDRRYSDFSSADPMTTSPYSNDRGSGGY